MNIFSVRKVSTLFFVCALFAFLTPPAIAQDAPDLRVNSPAITELVNALKERFPTIKPLLESGVLGIKTDGLLAVRDPSAVPLADRPAVTELIAAHNRDRTALPREVALANGHPEWESQIADTFNRKWREKIPVGWWMQDENGKWTQKQ
ncbi:MAG: YdbL family protein [Zoogloeaceae bacterium]|jgi:hypothetical protein|nr:YdbL family protein [Zoogloeaceae bacterium]